MIVTVAADFTFHNVSINTEKTEDEKARKENFTFHNVSINTLMRWKRSRRH